jgi:GntR family transcriptional repressor for pyruvate dehydrogenase complex
MDKISSVIAREIVHDMRGKPPMTMLPAEAAMLEKYQVGRASLREALRVLEAQGIIIIRPGPGGGPMVAAVDSSDLARMSSLYFHLAGATYNEVLEARMALEPVMARRAAEREDRESLGELEALLTRPQPEDEAEYLLQSSGFHSVVCGLSGNRVLDLQVRALKDLFADRIEGTTFPGAARERIVNDHRRIARAIISGNGARAEKLMREHMIEFLAFSVERNPGVLEETVQWR